MKILTFAVLLMMFCSLNLFAQTVVNNEEYAVYAAVMDEIYTRNSKHNELYAKNSKDNEIETSFVILENTIEPDQTTLNNNLKSNRILDYLNATTPPNSLKTFAFDELLKNLKENNKNSAKLDGTFPVEYKYSYVSKSELDKLLEEGKKEYEDELKRCKCVFTGSGSIWQPFFRKYKTHSGYYSLSKVGFSFDGQFALVFFKTESGDQGSSTFYVLEKVNDKWQVRKNFGSAWVT